MLPEKSEFCVKIVDNATILSYYFTVILDGRMACERQIGQTESVGSYPDIYDLEQIHS